MILTINLLNDFKLNLHDSNKPEKNQGLAMSLANQGILKNFNSKNDENLKLNRNNILISKANRKEIKIERVERAIKINKNHTNTLNGTNNDENNECNNITEIIITLPDEKKDKVPSKSNRVVIELPKKQPRKIEIIPPKRLICEDEVQMVPKIVEQQTKELIKIGNNFIRIPQEDNTGSCEFFCDYLHINDPQYLTDINQEIYRDLIKNQVVKLSF